MYAADWRMPLHNSDTEGQRAFKGQGPQPYRLSQPSLTKQRQRMGTKPNWHGETVGRVTGGGRRRRRG